ncbi:MAG: hypothetical protein WAY88_00815 [Minisyncoccia bacterium]
MQNYFKKLVVVSVLLSFFFFGQTIFAADDTSDIAICATEAIATSLASNAAAEVVAILPKTGAQGESATGAALAITASTAVVGASPIVVNDVALNVKASADAVLNSADKTFNNITKMNLNMLAYSVGQCALTQLTNNTVKWIQGGFQGGSPKFAVDTRTLFEDIGKGVTADFANQIRGIQTCDFTPNFKYDLANSVETFGPKRAKYSAQIQCPFAPMNVSAQAVYNDFSVAGWSGFAAMLGEGGNKFAVKMNTANEVKFRQEEAKKREDQRLGWSNGFVDIIDKNNCTWPDEDTYWSIQSGDFPPEAKALYEREYCKTTTPGKIVGDELTKSLGVDMDRLGFADDMNKIISALIGQLTKQAVTGLFTAIDNATPTSGPSSNTSGGNNSNLPPSVFVFTEGSASVTQDSALLIGRIGYTGIPGTTWFEYGVYPNLTNTTPKWDYPAGSPTTFTETLSGLTPNTRYLYRAFVKSARGEMYGDTASFTTNP